MTKLKEIGGLFPGFIMALAIAAVAKLIESLIPIHIIGASVIALASTSLARPIPTA